MRPWPSPSSPLAPSTTHIGLHTPTVSKQGLFLCKPPTKYIHSNNQFTWNVGQYLIPVVLMIWFPARYNVKSECDCCAIVLVSRGFSDVSQCTANLWQPPRHAAAALLSTSYNCTAEWTHPSKSHASLHTFAQGFLRRSKKTPCQRIEEQRMGV